MKRASVPFVFVTASYLVRIVNERATTLAELARGMRACPDASIFFHTFQSLESHDFADFSSDFAQWAISACNDPELAERLAALDVRDFISIAQLREELARRLDEHIARGPEVSTRSAFEPFYFCEAVPLTVPRGEEAWTLAELADGIRRISLQTVHHHFINSRLRLRLETNDFSFWIQQSLGLPELARELNHVDIYTNTLENVRAELLERIEPWLNK